MAHADNLRPGSFRGVPFLTKEHGAEGGRRGELHEYPERDRPWFEDLGRKSRRWSLEVLVAGTDVLEKRDALVRACEEQGAGTLIHPYLGQLSVVCEGYRLRESTAELGIAYLSLEFSDAGEPVTANAVADTASVAQGAADQVQAAAPARFASSFSSAGFPAFVELAAATDVRSFAEWASGAATNLGGLGQALRAYESGLASFPAGALSLVRSPLQLGHAIVGLVVAVAGLSASPLARVRALRRLLGASSGMPGPIAATPARLRQSANAAAFMRLTDCVVAAEAVRAASAVRFSSYEEAISLRDLLADDLDAAATAAADAGDDDALAMLDRLRLVMVRDITARGGSLERLYDFTPQVTEPALTIIQRVDGAPASIVDRADELVARNSIVHPGFVPGGKRLQLRTLAEGGANA